MIGIYGEMRSYVKFSLHQMFGYISYYIKGLKKMSECNALEISLWEQKGKVATTYVHDVRKSVFILCPRVERTIPESSRLHHGVYSDSNNK